MAEIQVLVEGLAHPEGPAPLDDGSVVFVETRRSRLSQWHPEQGVTTFCDIGGSPNACATGDDGVYVAQSGGGFGGWEPERPATPSIQCVSWTGEIRGVLTEVDGQSLRAPNDLCFGPDGRLYFTDPGPHSLTDPVPGYVYGLGPDGSCRVLEVGPTFPNGVVVTDDGEVVWVETYTRRVMAWAPDGRTRHLATLPEGHLPDGLAVSADRNLYIASIESGGLDVVSLDGRYVTFLRTGSRPLNCTFLGTGLLIACDATPEEERAAGTAEIGRLLLVAADVTGLQLCRGSV